MSYDCFVCAEQFINKKIIIECPFCKFVTCVKCIKRVLLDSNKIDKCCMNCNKTFTRSILVNFFGKVFMNKHYKDNIKELLFKEEELKIPESMPEVILLSKIANINIKILNINREIDLLQDNRCVEFYLKHGEIKGYNNYISSIKVDFTRSNRLKTNRVIYKYPCSKTDCVGFVNDKWYCELCDKTTCNLCFNIKDENHKCKKDDVETALLIKKDSKPCPKCNISIMKSSGCNQMWCVMCHTTFDWLSLKIKDNGQVHNPEYFRYMRENGLTIVRTNGDNPCHNLLNDAFTKLTQINNSIKIKDSTQHKYITIIFDLYRDINHIEAVEIPTLRRQTLNLNNWKNTQRVRYLMKYISEKQYKSNLVRKYKEIAFLDELYSIQNTIYEVCKESFIMILNDKDTAFSDSTILVKLKDFIRDFKKNINNILIIYDYNKLVYTPSSLLY